MGITQVPSTTNKFAKIWKGYSATNSTVSAQIGYPTHMIYANGTYAITTDTGFVVYSTDAKNWSTVKVISSGNLYSIAYGNGTWVAVGSSNQLYSASSISGTWTARTSAITGTNDIYDVAWIPNWSLFVVVGTSNTSPYNFLSTSPDGITWTARKAGGSGVAASAIAWDGNSTVVVGTDLAATAGVVSTNGTTWTNTSINGGAAYSGSYGPIVYYPGAISRFYHTNDYSQTAASATTTWVNTSRYRHYNFATLGDTGSNHRFYHGNFPRFDSVNNYMYQFVGTSSTLEPKLATFDTSTLATVRFSSPTTFYTYPLLNLEPLPGGILNGGNMANYTTSLYQYLNGIHFNVIGHDSGYLFTIYNTAP